MAFTQTTATNLQDVITQIIAYGVANSGFISLGSVTLPANNYSLGGGETMYGVQIGSVYHYFIAVQNNTLVLTKNYIIAFTSDTPVSLYPKTTTTPTRINSTPDKDSCFSAWNFPGPYASLYMFATPACVHAVVELSAGVFNHISLGIITKTDTIIGGEYLVMGAYQYYTSYFDSALQLTVYNLADATSYSNHLPWVGSGLDGSMSTAVQTGLIKNYMRYVQPNTAYGDRRDFAPFGSVEYGQKAAGCTYGYIIDSLLRDSPNTATQRSVMFPQYIMLLDAPSGTYNMAGYIPNCRIVSMRGLSPKDIIYNDWQVFPVTTKNPTTIYASGSGNIGLAYRRI